MSRSAALSRNPQLGCRPVRLPVDQSSFIAALPRMASARVSRKALLIILNMMASSPDDRSLIEKSAPCHPLRLRSVTTQSPKQSTSNSALPEQMSRERIRALRSVGEQVPEHTLVGWGSKTGDSSSEAVSRLSLYAVTQGADRPKGKPTTCDTLWRRGG